ncbi:hypothetical protein CSAL01_11373 [Colletotrichum salicis]|uniref:Uncharacterized protein n=1 Tax=Colletotrichum salicis TaxID=1209931 RepID=A0A135URP8_9PEZI|nr:hypothetical protein CSAL01_11373 [Colletotrichum salicis]
MLGLLGEPTDGTYNVQPRQMNVNEPRIINYDEASFSDEAISMPKDTATTMSYFIRRIQLANIARSVIDSRAPGMPDAEIMNYERVLELDGLFEDAMADFPPFLRPDGPFQRPRRVIYHCRETLCYSVSSRDALEYTGHSCSTINKMPNTSHREKYV